MKKLMSSLGFIALFIFLSIDSTTAQSSIVTDTLVVNGDCNMCKKRIETACFGLKGMKTASWDDEALKLIVSYDSKKTSADAILKRVALIGYDNQNYKADDKAYYKLDECCQYDRSRITTPEPKK